MPPLDWRGLTAVILAIGVAVAIIITLAGAVLSSHVVTAEESNLLSGVIGAAVGALATYLGGAVVLRQPDQPPQQNRDRQPGPEGGQGDGGPDPEHP